MRTIDFQTAWESTACAMMLSDRGQPDHLITQTNPAFTRLTGYSADEAAGRDPRFLQGPGTDRAVTSEIRQALEAGLPISREILNYRKNGEAFWNQLTLSPIIGEMGEITGFVGVSFALAASDLATQVQEDRLRLAEIVRNVPGFVYRRALTVHGEIQLRYLSPSLNEILGIEEGVRVESDDFFRHVHPDDLDRVIAAVRRSAETLQTYREEFRLVSRKGAVRWFRSEAPARRHANGEVVWDGLAIDITAEKTSEAALAFMTFHDSLTGLSNRARFMHALVQAMESLDPDENVVGVFIIDLDAFQEVNDTLGQAAGDEILRTLGRNLLEFAQEKGGVVARIGGDEFAVLIPAIPISQATANVAEALHGQVARPMRVEDREIAVSCSMGVAIFPPPREARHSGASDGGAELMKQADMALHEAKREEPGGYRLYAPEFDDRLRNRMVLRQSLQQAIVERQFELHYQPIVTLANGRVAGAEALVRWTHPRLGMQLPGVFIPMAEASGLIAPLGEWIVGEALWQGEDWRRAGIGAPCIAINLSSIQLRRSGQPRKPGFVDIVERALADTGADPQQFEFELTEGVLIESSDDTLAVLKSLKALGFGITIDDFGTGHSTFRYLRDFPINKIKIDRSFVSRIGVDAADETIVRSMINLSRNLGIKVVAEGIETRMQRDFLINAGCELGQGYLFSLPLKPEDFGWILDRRLPLATGAEQTAPLPRLDAQVIS